MGHGAGPKLFRISQFMSNQISSRIRTATWNAVLTIPFICTHCPTAPAAAAVRHTLTHAITAEHTRAMKCTHGATPVQESHSFEADPYSMQSLALPTCAHGTVCRSKAHACEGCTPHRVDCRAEALGPKRGAVHPAPPGFTCTAGQG